MRLSALERRHLPWLLAGLHGLAFADRFLIAPLAAPLEHGLHLSDVGLGLALGPAVILSYVVFVFVLGRRLTMQTARRVLPWSLLTCALAVSLGAFASGPSMLLLSRGLLGVGEAGFDAAALLLLASEPVERRGRALGLFTAGSIVGKALAFSGAGLLLNLIGGALGERLAAPLAWRLVMLIFGVATGAAGLVPTPGAEASTGEEAPLRRTLTKRPADARVTYRYLGLMIPMGAGVFISQAFTSFAPLALARRYHVSQAHVGELLGGILLIAGLAGSQLGGEIATRTRRPDGAVLAGPLCVVVLAAAALWMSGGVAQAGVFVAIIVLALSVLAPLGLDHLQRATPAPEQGRVVSSYLSAATLIAFGLGPPSVGLLSTRLTGPGGTVTAICGIVVLAGVIGAGGALGLRRRSSPAFQPLSAY